ncbi:hypothetical protein BJQ89_03001 [Arthrobacter sp. ES1]|nr:hypothetical protein [Arthrobacter sp. ES1]
MVNLLDDLFLAYVVLHGVFTSGLSLGCRFTLRMFVEIAIARIGAQPVAKYPMLRDFWAVVAENVQIAGGFNVPEDAMTEPPRFTNFEFKSDSFEGRDVGRLVIWISDDQVDIDDGYSWKPPNRR